MLVLKLEFFLGTRHFVYFEERATFSISNEVEDYFDMVHEEDPQCPKHPDKPLDLFCETCEEMICQHCSLKLHHELDHEHDCLCLMHFPSLLFLCTWVWIGAFS